MQKLISIVLFLFISTIISAQVNSVSFMLDFDYQDGDTLYYDCNLRINSGSATTISQRVQFNSQYSIVTPSDVEVEVVESYMPFLNNSTYNGTEPIEWQLGSIVTNDPALPGFNFNSITPYIYLQTYHYNDLYAGDIVTIFRISVIGENTCPLAVRIYKNGEDPTSADLAGGNDFSNGFTLGSLNQLYTSNFYSNDYADDIDITLDNAVVCVGELAALSLNLNCVPADLSYFWNTGEITPSISVYNEGSLEYSVTITGPNDYSNILTAEVNNVQSFLSGENDNTLCIGGHLDLKLDNGTWISSDPNIISVSSEGVVTGLASGTAIITYIDNDNECGAEVLFTVVSTINVSITGEDEICIGGTTTLSSGGEFGTWVSSDPSIGTTTNSGIVTGVNAGQVTFVFTSNETLCQSNPSPPATVYPPSIVTLNETQICPGQSAVASATLSGTMIDGTWVSNNPSVATIHATTGLITAISEGCTTFSFTNYLGCSVESEMLCVSPEINALIIGSDQICVGGTTQLNPSSGGLWVSADNLVAVVDHTGLVTGIGLGTTTFTFQDTINYCADGTTGSVTIGNIQGIANVGSSEICVGTTTQLSPNTGGIWTSDSPGIAVTNLTGEVTGISNGISQFDFTTNLPNCEVVDEVINILVNELPTIELTGPESICVNDFTTISTDGILQYVEYGGTTYNSNGSIIGVEPGTTQYYAMNSEGCSSDTIEISVLEFAPLSFAGPDTLCIGEVTQVYPSVGGVWTSSDNTVATITNNGLVTAVDAGNAILDFIDNANGCIAGNGLQITVNNVPNVSIQENIICVGSSTQVSPTSGGTWTSSNVLIATINNIGHVTAKNGGIVHFTYVSNDTQCPSEPIQLTVLSTSELNTNKTEICLDETLLVELSQSTSFSIEGPEGFFTVLDSQGEVIFPAPGIYLLTPIDENSTGCELNFTEITVYDNPTIEITSSSTIFVGDTLEILSTSLLTSIYPQDESIVTQISNTSIIGVSEGVTQITGISEEGCKSNTIQVTVISANPCQGLDTINQSYILGTAYIDNNKNGTYDTGDAPLRNVVISTGPGDFSILTDDDGNYTLPVVNGSYSLTAQVNEGSWLQNIITIDNVEISGPCNEGYNFAFVPMSSPEETATLSMVNTIARCNFETKFTITVENTGAEPFNGVLAFTYDDKTTLFTTDLVDFQVNGNTLSSEIETLQPFSPRTYRVTVKMPGGSSNLPLLAFEAKLYNQTGELIEDYGYTDQLRCSYDPNDKREYPSREGAENLTLMDEDIEYTIRFQNNGNDTAFQVRIVDQLDPNIDPSTIRVVNSSHDVETCIEGTDLIFLFEDILLVDSTTNYAASQGFVTFRCNTKDGRAEMTPVHNQANIIFDTNAPIVTNQTLNTLVTVLCTDKNTMIQASICQGETFEGHMVSGTYTESFDLLFGCDSIVTIVLDVQGITVAQNTIDICQGESIFFNGINYDLSESTEIIDTILNENGCIKEVLSLQVNVTQINFSQEDITACEGDEIVINGNTYMFIETTEVIDSFYSANGCISDIQTFQLIVLPTIYEQFDTTICEGFDYEGLTVAGTYTIDSFDLATGCQLEYTINLNVLPLTDPSCTVGTDNLDEDLVKLYPNPATESLFIETEDIWESIKIVDVSGKIITIVSNVEIGKLEVNVSQYLSGVYIIIFQHEDSIITKRFVVR